MNRWKVDYERLYNDVNGDTRTTEFPSNMDDNSYQTDTHNENPDCTLLNSGITIEEVRKAVLCFKSNKATGIDEIPSEVLKNDTAISLLFEIITYCFNESEVPDDWRRTIINPILKTDKDPRDPLGYRGIALISIPCKIYAHVLNQRLITWLEENQLLAEEQNGFRKNRSCVDHLYTLTNVIKNRKIAKMSTYVCFIDMKKAFDFVNRDLLWYKLMSIGVQGKFLDAVKSLYVNTECTVKVNDNLTSYFPVTQGVKQGCKISPTLFAAYINDLATDINRLNCGIDIGDVNLAMLLFADDIALIAPDAESLQNMLRAVHLWSGKWKLSVNQDKTKVIHFRLPSVQRSDHRFTCGDLDIAYDNKYRYLGLWLDEHLNFKFSVDELCKSASRALGALYSKYVRAGGMTYKVFNKLYKSVIEPVLYYASGIWGVSHFSKVNTIQNRAIRLFLGTSKYAPNIAIRGDIGWVSCVVNQYVEVFRLFFRINNATDFRLTYIVHEWSKQYRLSWVNKVKHLIEIYDLNNIVDTLNPTNVKLNMIKDVLFLHDNMNWQIDLFDDGNSVNGNKMRTYRIFKTNIFTESYVQNINICKQKRRILSNFRCGTLPLAIETGRYTKPKYSFLKEILQIPLKMKCIFY